MSLSFVVLLIAAEGTWTEVDEAQLAPVRERFGFSEGMRFVEFSPASVRTPRGFDAAAEDCGLCHDAAYQSWSRSRHAVAASNALFLEGWSRESEMRCLRCHAPRSADALAVFRTQQAASRPQIPRGIDCASCHVRDGAVLTARPVATAAHPTRHEPSLRSAEFCAGCHQFRFEHNGNEGAILTDAVTQDTWREWRSFREQGAQESCVDCHMRSDHLFPGAHAAGAGLRFFARLDGESLEVRADGVGHHFPTGDLFRHLRIEVAGRAGGFRTHQILDRTFALEDDGARTLKRLREDRTLRPSRPVRIELPRDTERWRIWYGYVDARLGLGSDPRLAPRRRFTAPTLR